AGLAAGAVPPEWRLALPTKGTAARFRIRYNDGKFGSGTLFSYARHDKGLYLVVHAGSPDVPEPVYCFVPQANLAEFTLDERLGTLLVNTGALPPDDLAAGLAQQGRMREKKIGEYLTGIEVVSPAQLSRALEVQRERGPGARLGDVLVAEGLITEEQLTLALDTQKRERGKVLGEVLIGMGLLDRIALKRVLTQKLGIPQVDLKRFPVDPNAIRLLPEATARLHRAVPLCRQGGSLVVALENPLSHEAISHVAMVSGFKVDVVTASEADISMALETYYGGGRSGVSAQELSAAMESDRMADETEEVGVSEADNVLVRMVNQMIMEAVRQGASDIHVEARPGRQPVLIRFRKDGVLSNYLEIPANFRQALLSRLKIMSDLDISEKRRPQDGKIDFARFGPVRVALRLATIPTNAGLENAVLRVLGNAAAVPLTRLDLDPALESALRMLIERPYGMLLVCGPTGSGKTTTLHSLLRELNTPERKIWTAEDPVEITQEGLNQVQVAPKLDWGFAQALRGFLRADPDVVMVGEMRDQETAQVAIQASLTGHLVLSTLHTNSASESVTRLLEMGMDPFNFADALLGVLAQRLARRLCGACKRPSDVDERQLDQVALEYSPDGTDEMRHALVHQWREAFRDIAGKVVLHEPVGCPECEGKGYKGRVALQELLVVSPDVRSLIQHRAPVSEIAALSATQGRRSLKQDGIRKALQGHTTLQQVRAVAA
ncbi:MAG: ATPase, T2SS/T4P/T4SS family, partial [Betaproteobacteria bacterium]